MVEKDDQNNKPGEDSQKYPYSDADNEYGLPEAEYSAIEREQQAMPEQPVAYESAYNEDEDVNSQQKNSSWPMWVALAAILFLVGGGIYFFIIDDSGNTPEVAEKPAEGTNTYVVEEEPEPVSEPEENAWEVEPEPEPEVREGSVSTLSSRTGRYYVIVGSFIDGDLANDHAQELAKAGVNAKIIQPSGTQKFYRLSVNDAEELTNLTAKLDSLRAKYGEKAWIVKY